MPTDNFTNQSINPGELPDASTQPFTPLSTVYIKVNLICRLVFGLIVVSLLLALQWQPWISLPQTIERYLPELQLATVVLGLLISAYGVIADKQKAYAIREHDFSYRSGVVFKSVISQPILRIQHIELKHGPIDRYFGLAQLEIFSAGGSAYTFSIPGLAEQKAREIRAYVLAHGDIAAND